MGERGGGGGGELEGGGGGELESWRGEGAEVESWRGGGGGGGKSVLPGSRMIEMRRKTLATWSLSSDNFSPAGKGCFHCRNQMPLPTSRVSGIVISNLKCILPRG